MQQTSPGEILCYSALFPKEADEEEHPIYAFKSTSDPDTMNDHEAMRQKDKQEFL